MKNTSVVVLIAAVAVICSFCATDKAGFAASTKEKSKMPIANFDGSATKKPFSIKRKSADRTLVSWFCFDEKTPDNCSVLTVQAHDAYDAIAFGQTAEGKWSAASENNNRTQNDGEQAANKTEKILLGKFIQMAVVYKGNDVTIYRNGDVYARYTAKNKLGILQSPLLKVAIGPVKLIDGVAKCFKGKVDDVRIYASALTQQQIKSLKPNIATEIEPFAWWNFEPGIEYRELTGRFPETRPAYGTTIESGKLVLGTENSYMWTGDCQAVRMGRLLRQKFMEDPTRPIYHMINSEGDNDRRYPTDPNISIYWKGRYHIFYMYAGDTNGWAHLSSVDLIHWRREKTDCAPTGSGGFFINKKGQVTYVGGFGYTTSSDDNLEHWSKPVGFKLKSKSGQDEIRAWDPTGWMDGDTYYVMSMFGGNSSTSKKPTLIKSKDLRTWEFVGEFMSKEVSGGQPGEDYSCSDFFKIGDKHMWLLISHNLGCRYYLGQWENEQFTPEFHDRMNWDTFRMSTLFPAPQVFAPTTLLTPDGRRIMFAWLPGGGNTLWSGTFCLPRELSLPKDGVLRIKPLKELQRLRYNKKVENHIKVKAEEDYRLKEISGDTLELNVTIKADKAKKYGVRVLCDQNNKGLDIFYSVDDKTISIGDGLDQPPATLSRPYTVAPFELKAGEDLKLRIFIDKPIVEVFANERQAVYRKYPHKPEDIGVTIFSHSGDIEADVTAWEMAASNQW